MEMPDNFVYLDPRILRSLAALVLLKPAPGPEVAWSRQHQLLWVGYWVPTTPWTEVQLWSERLLLPAMQRAQNPLFLVPSQALPLKLQTQDFDASDHQESSAQQQTWELTWCLSECLGTSDFVLGILLWIESLGTLLPYSPPDSSHNDPIQLIKMVTYLSFLPSTRVPYPLAVTGAPRPSDGCFCPQCHLANLQLKFPGGRCLSSIHQNN